MSMDDLAHDAFTAQAFTGQPPTGLPEGFATGGVFALDENQPVTTEIVKRLVAVVIGTDFTTTFFPTGGCLFLSTGEMTLAESADSPRYEENVDNEVMLSLLTDQLGSRLSRFRGQLQDDTYFTIEQRLPVFLDPEEFENGDAFPDSDSFTLMFRFLADHPNLQAPRIGLSRVGNFVISWRAARDKLTTLEFQPDGTIRWLVFAPPAPGKSAKVRASGDSPSNNVMKHIAPYQALGWMKRA